MRGNERKQNAVDLDDDKPIVPLVVTLTIVE